MPLPVFRFSVDANNAVRTNTYRTKSVQFGEGYKQLAPAGINNKLDTWDLTLPLLTDAVVAQVEAFFDSLGQHQNFNWIPPRGTSGIYRLTSPIKYQAQGLDRFGATRTTVVVSIERVYIDSGVNTLPSISVLANGTAGWNILRSGGTSGNITVNYSLSVIPTGGVIQTSNQSVVIASGLSSVVVAANLINNSTIQTLSILTGVGYLVGAIDSATISTPNPQLILDLRFDQVNPIDATGKIVTPNGGYNRSLSTYNGLYSGQFNGSNAWLLVEPSLDWDLNNTDITIECLLNPTTLPSGTFYPNVSNLLHHGNPNANFGWALILEKDHLNLSNNDVYIVRALHGINSNTWNKLAYTKQLINGANYIHRLFVNDLKIAEITSAVNINFNPVRGLTVGCEEYGNLSFYSGLINKLKIFKSCLYT